MEKKIVLLTKDDSQKRKKYVVLKNQDNKIWILPKKNLRVAFNIYQPNSFKGKFVKKLLPYIIYVPFLKKILHIGMEAYKIDENIQRYVSEIFGEETVMSFFLGTPSVHQKITIQVSKGNEILGYCKLTNCPEVRELFNSEVALLQQFEKQGIDSVPRYLGTLNLENMLAFSQSTIKTGKSFSVNYLQELHFSFLNNLFEKTKQSKFFKETEYAQALEQLKSYTMKLELPTQRAIIVTAINKVEKFYKNRKVVFSVYHGDFTPWNVFIEDGKLFVFDFEYAKKTYPPYLDLFHFFTQVRIHVEHKEAVQIYSDYLKDLDLFNIYVKDSKLVYTEYLLDIIRLYLSRSKGDLTKNEKKSMDIWIELLDKLK